MDWAHNRLQSYSSPASTPPHSSSPSRASSAHPIRTHEPESLEDSEHAPLLSNPTNEYGTLPVHHHHEHPIDGLPHQEHLPHRSVSVAAIPPPQAAEDDIFSGGHHRFESRSSHSHHSGGPGRRQSLQKISEDFQVTATPVGSQRVKTTSGSKDTHGHDHGAHHRPHNMSHTHDHGHVHLTMEEWDPDSGRDEEEVEVTAEVKIGHRRQVVGILMLQIGIMIHSLVIGLTLAITTGSEFTSLVAAIIFHQLFEGLSLGIRIANLPSTPANAGWIRRIFKLSLAFTFAITTPIGIAIGLATFGHGKADAAYLKLIQGLMSAISAGMLIYAACVEMLAGDFVMDPLLWRSSIKRQVLAVVSVFMGVAGMALIG
ncbi:hypothetical protein QCA50_015215 [Cerrena zonata]|uniref:Zinc/iron permease n=1 Tax=Cerrena zonata TaxID=2478898 RepID=A0AAW0FX18_9APHY